MFILLGVGKGYMQLRYEPLLILSAAIAALVAKRVGVSWDDMLKGISEKISTATPSILILISVGILVGSWMTSGTIPMMIYYGMKIVSPRFIIVLAFVISAIISTFTGTSWGSAGTVGVALMGIATGLGVSLPATAGAVVAGAYFGDKISPLSDTTNLAPIAAGSELYEHIQHMLYTTVPAALISMVVYAIVGFNSSATTITNPETMVTMFKTLDLIFDWNLLLLLPPVIVVYGSVRKLPTLPVMLFSAFAAGVMGVTIQNFTLSNVFTAVVKGFNVSMVSIDGFDSSTVIWEVTRLINRGGMNSMTSVILITFCGFAFAGIVSKAGCLEVILEKLLKAVKSTGGLIVATSLSSMVMGTVTGSSYLSILIPGELFKDAYKERGLHPKNLSRTLEDSGTVFVPLVPWTKAGVYMTGTLGVATIDYAPWAIMCYLGFVFAWIYGFTGFGIAKLEDGEKNRQAEIV